VRLLLLVQQTKDGVLGQLPPNLHEMVTLMVCGLKYWERFQIISAKIDDVLSSLQSITDLKGFLLDYGSLDNTDAENEFMNIVSEELWKWKFLSSDPKQVNQRSPPFLT
jgi:hypothetical protein